MEIFLCRHGETEWSKSGQHTSTTDLSLTPKGEEEARALGKQLSSLSFNQILVSPLKRARQTAELAGFLEAKITPDLTEWNYGDLEGKTTKEIQKEMPGWTIFDGPVPSGEAIEEVSKRADHLLSTLSGKRVLLFSSGHISRVIAARFLGLPPDAGKYFELGSGSLSILGFYRDQPVIKQWNVKN